MRNPASERLTLALGSFIVLLAAWLRLWGLGDTEIGLHYDEAAMLLLVRNIAFGGSRPIFIEAYTGHEVAFHYFAALVLRFGHDGVFGLRLTSAWIGVVTTAATLAATRALLKPHPAAGWIALFAALGVAVAFPHVVLSRYGFRAIAQPLFQALAIAALWMGLRARRRRWLIAGGALTGAVLHTYLAARLFPLPLSLAFGWWLMQTRTRRAARDLILVLSSALLVVAPLAFFFAQHPDALTVRIAQVAAPSLESARDGILKVAQAFFLPGRGDPYIRFNLPGVPLLDPISTALFFIGVAALVRWQARTAAQQSARVLIVSALFVLPLASALATNEITPSNLRLIGVYPFITIPPAVGAAALLTRFARLRATPHLQHAALIAFATLGTWYTHQRYTTWAALPELFRENHGEMVMIARALDALDPRLGTAYILSEHYRHPTVAALAQRYAAAKWLTGGASLVLPPEGGAVYFVPVTLTPPEPWPSNIAARWQATPLHAPNGAVVAQQIVLSAEAVRAIRNALEPVQADFAHVVGVRDVQPLGACRASAHCTALVTWEVMAHYPALQAVVRLFHPALGEWGRANPFHYPTGEWGVGEIVLDQIAVPVPFGVPPLPHRFGVGFFNPETMERLPRLDTQERFAGIEATFEAGYVEPHRIEDPAAARCSAEMHVPIQHTELPVQLIGWSLPASPLRAGERFMLELCWHSREKLPTLGETPLVVRLHSTEAQHMLYRGAPAMGNYPFSRWQAGLLVRDRLFLRLPYTLAEGSYQLSLFVGEHLIAELGTVQVTHPPRRFELPAPQHPARVTLGDKLEVLGYDLALIPEQQALHIRLYWRALQPLEDDFTLFVHLTNETGALVAQSDHQPLSGTYPTSLWAPKEIIEDVHTLSLIGATEERYALRVGAYLPLDGTHLLTPTGERAAPLGMIALKR